MQAEEEDTIRKLTEDGYKGVKLVHPGPGDYRTKVIITQYPMDVELHYVLSHPDVDWAKRNVVWE